MPDKDTAKHEYEVIEAVDFGVLRDRETRALKPAKEDEREYRGLVEPTPEDEPNPKVTLTRAEAAPLLEAGAIKPAGSDTSPTLAHDNPEELGYEGEAARDAAVEEEKKQSSKSSSSGASSSSSSSSSSAKKSSKQES